MSQVDQKPQHIGLTFRVPIEFEDALQGLMMMSASVDGMEEKSDGSITYFIPIPEFDDTLRSRLDAFRQEVRANSDEDVELIDATILEIKDWNAEWEASIEPVLIGESLVIAPSWKREEALKLGAPHLMIIDPKMSFGTGHHETTRLCLRVVDKLDITCKTVLDIGTGSGVLAMYALMKGASRTVGLDTDPWSIDNSVENRAKNGFVETQFDVRMGELAQVVPASEQYDLIFANIHRNVLLAISEEIRERAARDGHLIMSGLLIYDAKEVIAEYERVGFHLAEQLQENEWVALHFTT